MKEDEFFCSTLDNLIEQNQDEIEQYDALVFHLSEFSAITDRIVCLICQV